MILLDTCTLSYFFKKDPIVISNFKLHSPQELKFSAITEMEIEYGFKLHPERTLKLRPTWEKLKTQLVRIPFGEKEAFHAGLIRSYLKEKGKPIGAYDVLIGATALTHHLILATSNIKEFSHIAGLKTKDWRKED